MTLAEILAELPTLSRSDRLDILRHMVRMEDGAQILEECGRNPAEVFRMLDEMEREDDRNSDE